MTRHVFNAFLAENETRRELYDEREAQSSRRQRRDGTRQERRGADGMDQAVRIAEEV